MATQNEDLAILKILVEQLEKKRNTGDDVELGPLNQNSLKDLLFCEENIFLPKVIAKENDIGKYLRKVYKEEFNEDYKSLNDVSSTALETQTDALEDAKALYEIQSQQGDLDLSMDFATGLNLSRNIELLIINNMKHFENFERMKSPLMNLTKHDKSDQIIVQIFEHHTNQIQSSSIFHEELFESSVNHSNMTLVSYFFERFCYQDRERANLFEKCHPSKTLAAIKGCPETFKRYEDYVIQAFRFAYQQESFEDILDLAKKYPEVAKMPSLLSIISYLEVYVRQKIQSAIQQEKLDDIIDLTKAFPEIAEKVDLSNMFNSAAIQRYPEKFQYEVFRRYIIKAFQVAVQKEFFDDVLALTNIFPALTKEGSLFDNCHPTKIIATIKTHPEIFRHRHLK